jgi:hypothetical protein
LLSLLLRLRDFPEFRTRDQFSSALNIFIVFSVPRKTSTLTVGSCFAITTGFGALVLFITGAVWAAVREKRSYRLTMIATSSLLL